MSCKNPPPPPPSLIIVALLYPGDHDLNKLDSTLPKNAFTQLKVCIANWFLHEEMAFKDFSSLY